MNNKFNRMVLELAESEMRQQLLSMPNRFTSREYLDGFVRLAPAKYDAIVSRYLTDWPRPHAEWIANREITHTLRNKFSHMVTKVGDCENPKGGIQSEWNRR
jgi:hypothetical protein